MDPATSTPAAVIIPLKAWFWWIIIAPLLVSTLSWKFIDVHQINSRDGVGTLPTTSNNYYDGFVKEGSPSPSHHHSSSSAVDDVQKLGQHSHVVSTYSILLQNVKLQAGSCDPMYNSLITMTCCDDTESHGHHEHVSGSDRNSSSSSMCSGSCSKCKSTSSVVELSFKLSDVGKYVPSIAALKDGMQHELWTAEPLLKVSACILMPTTK